MMEMWREKERVWEGGRQNRRGQPRDGERENTDMTKENMDKERRINEGMEEGEKEGERRKEWKGEWRQLPMGEDKREKIKG